MPSTFATVRRCAMTFPGSAVESWSLTTIDIKVCRLCFKNGKTSKMQLILSRATCFIKPWRAMVPLAVITPDLTSVVNRVCSETKVAEIDDSSQTICFDVIFARKNKLVARYNGWLHIRTDLDN